MKQLKLAAMGKLRPNVQELGTQLCSCLSAFMQRECYRYQHHADIIFSEGEQLPNATLNCLEHGMHDAQLRDEHSAAREGVDAVEFPGMEHCIPHRHDIEAHRVLELLLNAVGCECSKFECMCLNFGHVLGWRVESLRFQGQAV